jgi:uncharacterized protein
MFFEWDDNKNKENIKKHGINFDEAALVFTDPNREIIIDNRKNYLELREIVIGKSTIGSNILLLTVVMTEKPESFRIISARLANKKETKLYYGHNS